MSPAPDSGAVVEGVVVVVARAGRLLVIRRAPGTVAAGAWCFVGGAIEPGETQQAAGAREFAEEVGGTVALLRKVWEYRDPQRPLRLHWWLGRQESAHLRPNPFEVSELRWCSLDELAALPGLLESNRAFLEAAHADLSALLAPDGDGHAAH